MPTIDKQIKLTKTLNNKKVDSFEVYFHGIDGNRGNFLGRQVKSIERPTVSFNTSELRNKGIRTTNMERIEFQDISIVLHDDEDSLTLSVLYKQLYKQAGRETKNKSPMRAIDDAKFEIGIRCFNAAGGLVESIIMRECFIKGITQPQLVYQEQEESDITLSVVYDGVDYEPFDFAYESLD